VPSDRAPEPVDRTRAVLGHIRENIVLAQGFLGGLDATGFAADLRTRYAVTRCLEIISEASRRLDPGLRARHPQIPWPQVAAAGNIFRHEYEGVRPEVLWRTVKDALPPLLAAVDAELSNA
jgi:uncharacterized protein with HEPN domain